MTVVEYIRRKNDILKRATGLVLVPEDQIKEVKTHELTPLKYLGAHNCPYCKEYLIPNSGCTGCPMYESSNPCLSTDVIEMGVYSTYIECEGAFKKVIIKNPKYGEELYNLTLEFNKELEA